MEQYDSPSTTQVFIIVAAGFTVGALSILGLTCLVSEIIARFQTL
jgi:hypothetical protein